MMGVMVGTVRISLPGSKGKNLILADLPAGEFFGEIALLDGKPRSASATALTKCELLVLERRDFLPFLEHTPTARLFQRVRYARTALEALKPPQAIRRPGCSSRSTDKKSRVRPYDHESETPRTARVGGRSI
jgi:CRP-like cAMP-binding protein